MTITKKRYQCQKCGTIELKETNHYGQCYPKCTKCRRQGEIERFETGKIDYELNSIWNCLDLPEDTNKT